MLRATDGQYIDLNLNLIRVRMRVKHQGSLAVTQTNRVRRERPPERAVADRTGGPLAQALWHSEACGPVAAFGPRVRGFQGPLRVGCALTMPRSEDVRAVVGTRLCCLLMTAARPPALNMCARLDSRHTWATPPLMRSRAVIAIPMGSVYPQESCMVLQIFGI
jgi:hypothetical protein